MSSNNVLVQLKDRMNKLKDECDEYQQKYDEKHQEWKKQQDTIITLENENISRKITMERLDIENFNFENRLTDALKKNEEWANHLDESERVRRAQEKRLDIAEERLIQLEEDAKQSRAIAEDRERSYEEVVNRLRISDDMLIKHENRAELATKKVVELDKELHSLTATLKSMEIGEEKSVKKENYYEQTLNDVKKRLKESEERSEMMERELTQRQRINDHLEEDNIREKLRYNKLKEEMDTCLSEINNI